MSHQETTSTTTTTTLVSTSTTTTKTTTDTDATTLEDAMKTVELVKEQINQYDLQSSKYKTALRNITAAAGPTNQNENNNSITIEWVKVRFPTVMACRVYNYYIS